MASSFVFIWPPPPAEDVNSYIGDIVLKENTIANLTWHSNFSDYTISMWQAIGLDVFPNICGNPYSTVGSTGLGRHTVKWAVDPLNCNLGTSSNFYLCLNYQQPCSARTQFFNISKPETSAVPDSSSVASSGHSTPGSVVVGLSAGLGIGILMLLILTSVLLWLLLRRRKRTPMTETSDISKEEQPMKQEMSADESIPATLRPLPALYDRQSIYEVLATPHDPVEIPVSGPDPPNRAAHAHTSPSEF